MSAPIGQYEPPHNPLTSVGKYRHYVVAFTETGAMEEGEAGRIGQLKTEKERQRVRERAGQRERGVMTERGKGA